jgi:hypothetical protein
MLLDAKAQQVYPTNITPDVETGIGSWTEAQFIRALKGSFRPDGTPILYPMEGYVDMTDEEAAAVFAYLRTVPPIRKTRPLRPAVVVPASEGQGKQVYYKYSCNSCHGTRASALRPAQSLEEVLDRRGAHRVHQGPVRQGAGDQDAHLGRRHRGRRVRASRDLHQDAASRDGALSGRLDRTSRDGA